MVSGNLDSLVSVKVMQKLLEIPVLFRTSVYSLEVWSTTVCFAVFLIVIMGSLDFHSVDIILKWIWSYGSLLSIREMFYISNFREVLGVYCQCSEKKVK